MEAYRTMWLQGSLLAVSAAMLSSCSTASMGGANGLKGGSGSSGGSANLSSTEPVPTGNGSGSGGLGELIPGIQNIAGAFCVTQNASGSSATSTANSSGSSSIAVASVQVSSANSSGTSAAEAKDNKAIAQCLKNWGNSPFTTASPYKRIAASVSVFGFGDAVDDETPTADPQLIVVDAAVNVLGNPTYKLENPNGWYCIVADVNVLTDVTIDLKQGAHLSDTSVGVNVLGKTTGGTAGSTDVNVLSCENVVVVP